MDHGDEHPFYFGQFAPGVAFLKIHAGDGREYF